MRRLAIALSLFVSWPLVPWLQISWVPAAEAGEIVRLSCTGCDRSVQVMLGRGRVSQPGKVPMVCRAKGGVTIIAVRAGARSSPYCPGGMRPLNFVEGMACPMCPGSRLHKERVGFWD
jgi:hypothetical protein